MNTLQTQLIRYNNGDICTTMLKAYVLIANLESDSESYVLHFNSAMQPVIEITY